MKTNPMPSPIRNAKDTKMNIRNTSTLSPRAGRGQGEGALVTRRTPRPGSPSPRPSPLGAGRGWSAGVFTLAAIATTMALVAAPAQAQNECGGDPAANGGAADAITCAAGTTYAGGITYTADGDLALTVPASTSTSNHLQLSGQGIVATAGGDDSLSWDSSGFRADIRISGALVDAVMDFSTATGDIGILTQESGAGRLQGFTNATYGIRAHAGVSTAATGDGGDINVSTYRIFAIDTGLEAISDGGHIAITHRELGATPDDSGAVIGSGSNMRRGIYAETSGEGTITLDLEGEVIARELAVHAVADGDIVVNNYGELDGRETGIGLLVDSGSTATINVLGSPLSQAQSEVLVGPMDGDSGIRGGVAAIRGLGQNVVLNVQTAAASVSPTRFGGRIDFSGLAGAAEVHVGDRAVWQLDTPDIDASLFSNGNDRVHLAAGSIAQTPKAEGTWAVDFNGGDDQLLNEGVIRLEGPGISGVGSRPMALQFLGLERLENAGLIDLGEDPCPTNCSRRPEVAVADDILMLPGTTLVGADSGRIRLDADLNAFSRLQDGCHAGQRGANGRLPVSDCIALHDGAIEGTVVLDLTQTREGGRGAYNPEGNVIIDLSDGAGGPGAGGLAEGAQVVLAPESRYYSPAFGGILDNGMFAYRMVYDEDAMQVLLVSLPSAGAFHQPVIANAAQSAWRTANASFFDRQADLRDTLRGSTINDHGVWLRTAYDDGERSPRHAVATAAGDTVYDNTHDLETSAVTLGVDLVRGGDADGHWLLGGVLGYIRTDIAYARLWSDTAAMNGMLAGLYGSYVDGPLFVDATFSGIWAQLDQDMPQGELFRGRGLTSDVKTQGLQLEAGWRMDLAGVRLEPLVNAHWSRTEIDEFKVPEDDSERPGNQVMFDDTTSSRIGAGLRGSRQFPVSGDLQLGVSLTGRFMSELDGEAKAAIGNLNPISPEVVDTWDGTFSEVIAGLTLANSTGRVSGVLNVGLRSGEDYDATSGSFSFRYQW